MKTFEVDHADFKRKVYNEIQNFKYIPIDKREENKRGQCFWSYVFYEVETKSYINIEVLAEKVEENDPPFVYREEKPVMTHFGVSSFFKSDAKPLALYIENDVIEKADLKNISEGYKRKTFTEKDYKDLFSLFSYYGVEKEIELSLCYSQILYLVFQKEMSASLKEWRTFLLEYVRALDHLKFFSESFLGIENQFFYEETQRVRRELFSHLNELYHCRWWTRFPLGVPEEKKEFLTWSRKTMVKIKKALEKTRFIDDVIHYKSFFRKNLNYSFTERSSAFLNYLSGPSVRSFGIRRDVRLFGEKFFRYSEHSLNVFLGTDGTLYEGYLLRLSELKESFRICNDIIGHFNISASHSFENNKNLPEKLSSSSLYTSLEASHGELGIKAKSGDKNVFESFTIRSPSYYHALFLKKYLPGHFVNDVPWITHSLRIISEELEGINW